MCVQPDCENPAVRGARKIAINPHRGRVLTFGRGVLDTDETLGLLAYVTLGLFAGLRRAEIERLDWPARKWSQLTAPSLRRAASETLPYLNAACVAFVETLVGPDANGRFRQKKNDDPNNPHTSIFETLHHLLCNTTGVTTEVMLVELLNQQIFAQGRLYWEDAYKPDFITKKTPFKEIGLVKVRS